MLDELMTVEERGRVGLLHKVRLLHTKLVEAHVVLGNMNMLPHGLDDEVHECVHDDLTGQLERSLDRSIELADRLIGQLNRLNERF